MTEHLNLFGMRKKRVMEEGEWKVQWPGMKWMRAQRFSPVGDFHVQVQSFLESGRGVPPCQIEVLFLKIVFHQSQGSELLRISSTDFLLFLIEDSG